MDPILLALIKKLQNQMVTGIKSYTYDADTWTLTAVLNDDSTVEAQLPVGISDPEIREDPNDEKMHLYVTLPDGSEADVGELPVGPSAYEVAQAQGYEGTVDEWLESLKGSTIMKEFTIASELNTWPLQHNLNTKSVEITCYDTASNKIIGDLEFFSNNLVYVHFALPVAGKAIVRK